MRILKNLIKRQAGYLLLEATLALSVAAGLMTYYIRERADRLTEDMAKSHGEQMRRIADAANRYSLDNFAAILNNTPVNFPASPLCPGGGVVANTRTPTLRELSCIGLLPAGFGAALPIFGGGYQLQLVPQPVGCLPGACTRIGGMLMTTAPVLPNGQMSAQVIGRALQAIGADGGATGMGGEVCAAGACRLVGLNGAWAEPAILAGIAPAAGLMGVQIGFDPNLWLRLDGTSTMAGPIQMGGNNIQNANAVSAATVNANTRISTPAVRFNNALPPTCSPGDIATTGGVLHQCIGGAWESINTTIDNRAATIANNVFTTRIAGVTIGMAQRTTETRRNGDATCQGTNEVVDKITTEHQVTCKTLKLIY